MNDSLLNFLIALKLVLILFNLIKSINCQIKDIECNKEEICFYKLDTIQNDEIKKDKKLLLKDANFMFGIKFSLKKPIEFSQNKDHNPFPNLMAEIYSSKKLIGNSFYIKIKSINRNRSESVSGLSFLEGDGSYVFPHIILKIPFPNDNANHENGYDFLTLTSRVREYEKDFFYSECRFPTNSKINLLKNPFTLDFELKNLNQLIKRIPTNSIKEDFFVANLSPYREICKEVRLDDGRSAENFRKEEVSKEKDEKKRKKYLMSSIVDYLRDINQLDRLGSMCGEMQDQISADVSCFKKKIGCKSFMKIEKFDNSIYHFHFFNKNPIAYIKISFLSKNKNKIQYEMICERFKDKTQHSLRNGTSIQNITEFISSFSGHNGLIYSSDKLFYCGLLLPIKKPFKILNIELEFDFSNQTNLQVEFGKLSEGKMVEPDTYQKTKTWFAQTSLDLNFKKVAPKYLEDKTVLLVASLIGIVALSVLSLSCYIVKKYKKLSLKLTEAGSRISNLDFAEGSNLSRSNLSNIPSIKTLNSKIYGLTSSDSKLSNNAVNLLDKLKIKKNKASKMPTQSSTVSRKRSIPKSSGFKVKRQHFK